MNNISSLSVAQLKRAITIKEQIEALEAQLAGLLGSGPVTPRQAPAAASLAAPQAKKQKVMSPAARAKIAAAQRARWAERKGLPAPKAPQAAKPVQASRPKPKMSAAGRANIIAAQKARWAKVKAAKAQPAAKPVLKAKSNVSAEARRKMAEAAKARWAKIRAAKGK